MSEFEEILGRLKKQTGIKSDKDVAHLLDMQPNAFNGRKKRGNFPVDKVYVLASSRPDLNLDPSYIVTGEPLSKEVSNNMISMFEASKNNPHLMSMALSAAKKMGREEIMLKLESTTKDVSQNDLSILLLLAEHFAEKNTT
jgi:hypothetical protein